MISRAISRLVFSFLGVALFYYLSQGFNNAFSPEETLRLNNQIGFMTAGFLLGILIEPWGRLKALAFHEEFVAWLQKLPPESAFSGFLGILSAGALSGILSIPAHLYFSEYRAQCALFFLISFLTLSYVGAIIFGRFPILSTRKAKMHEQAIRSGRNYTNKVLDSSILIDGRIYDLIKLNLVEGKIVVPGFIIDEIHKIAESRDPARKKRGRRGLEIIQKIRELDPLNFEIDETAKPVPGEVVDAQLLAYAQSTGAVLYTNDVTLNQAALARGVRTVNVNAASMALRPAVLPGEKIEVDVVKYGKESGQGIAYMEDGAMVVVEKGDRHIGETLTVEVTSLIQTAAGRLIFSRPV